MNAAIVLHVVIPGALFTVGGSVVYWMILLFWIFFVNKMSVMRHAGFWL
jgi:hypothetical protein